MNDGTNSINSTTEETLMADYLKVETRIVASPKIARLAKRLNVKYREMVGALVIMWENCKMNNEDGNVTKWKVDDFVFHAQWDADGKDFVKALREEGFLDKRGEFILMHDWLDYAGEHLRSKYQKRRADELKRIWEMHGRVYGARDQEGSRAPEDETENPGAAKKGRAKAKIKAATDETLMAMAFGKGIATDSELYAQWQKWIDYRRDEKRKPLSARGASDQLDWLLTQPNPAAIIQKSMRNEWTGLFEEKNNGRTNQTRTGHAGGTQAERAAFTHSPEDEKRLRDFEATIAERDRERNERSIAN